MRKIFKYLFIVLFSISSLQAGAHYCVSMDVQDEPNTSMLGDQGSCHLQNEEPAADDNQDNTCCDNECASCVSAGDMFNSLMNNFEFAYTDDFKQFGSFFIFSSHIKIPTPPPNS